MFEFISAGGLGEAAPAELATAAGEPLLAQGVRMRDALLGELSALPNLEISVADAGLAPLPEHRPMQAGAAAVQRLATAGVDYHVPFGGSKKSSYGSREQGFAAVEFYTQIKTSYSAG